MDEIDLLLKKATEKQVQKVLSAEDVLPKKILFTQEAFRKASNIGPIVEKLAENDLEWSGFMIARKGDPQFIVRDILIQKGQDIKFSNVKIDGKDITRASNEVDEQNKKNGTQNYVIGWIHAHGNVKLTPSPSTVDLENFNVALNSIGLNTEQGIKVPLKLIQTNIIKEIADGRLIYKGENLEDAVIEYVLSNKEYLAEMLKSENVKFKTGQEFEKAKQLLEKLLDSSQTTFYENKAVGFAHFVIMSNNLNTAPYASYKYYEENTITKKTDSKLALPKTLEKITVEDDISFTEESLEAEIKDRIDIPKKWHYVPAKGRGGKKKKRGVIGRMLFEEDYSDDDDYIHVQKYTPAKSYRSYGYETALFFSQRSLDEVEAELDKYKDAPNNEKYTAIKSFIDMLRYVDKSYKLAEQKDMIEKFFSVEFDAVEPDSAAEPKPEADTAQKPNDDASKTHEIRSEIVTHLDKNYFTDKKGKDSGEKND